MTTGTTNLTNVGSIFNNYSGTTNFSYKLRTTKVGGTGTLTLKVTSDFTAVTNGPSVATPPTAGDTLSYSCTVVGGTACSGPLTASTSSSTSVATWGADAHSAAAGTTGNSVSWTLVNDPLYPTGTYTATVTFTISST